MYVARWHFTVKFGALDDALKALRRWQLDVGERIGWKTGSIRVMVGVFGGSCSDVEYEIRAANLGEIEGAWAGMKAVPYHEPAMKELAEFIVSGSDRWTVHRVVDLTIG